MSMITFPPPTPFSSLSLSLFSHFLYFSAQLLKEAQSYAQVTPLQVSYLFELCSMEEKTSGSVSLSDFERLLPRPTSFSEHVAAYHSSVSTQSTEVCVGTLYNSYACKKVMESNSLFQCSNPNSRYTHTTVINIFWCTATYISLQVDRMHCYMYAEGGNCGVFVHACLHLYISPDVIDKDMYVYITF